VEVVAYIRVISTKSLDILAISLSYYSLTLN